MSIDGDFKDFEFELKEFFEIFDEFDGSFDGSLGFMESDFDDVEVDMFGKVFFKVVEVIDFIEGKVKNNFLELLELWQRFRDHVHFNLLKVIILEIQVNFL